MLEVARQLVRAGVSVRTAKKVLDELAADRTASVRAPSLADYDGFVGSIGKQGVEVRRIAHQQVNVQALRARLGVSQEAFALRYGLDVATVRNWEQGRTVPEGPAATLLQLIDRDPEKVVDLLASRE